MVAIPSVVSQSGATLHQWGDMAWRYVTAPDVLLTGYGNRSAAELFAALRNRYNHLNPIVIDIRISPRSDREEWGKEALTNLFGSRYRHLPSLGNKNYKPGSGPIEIVDMDEGLDRLAKRITAGYTPILLCGCDKAAGCHRCSVAEALNRDGYTTQEFVWPHYVAPKTIETAEKVDA